MAKTSYAFWNNKGGVGKSFLCFIAASEYANTHPETDVYVLDLCPQANVSEILLPAFASSESGKDDYSFSNGPVPMLMDKNPRSTIAGYLEERLNSPFRMIPETDVFPFVSQPSDYNKNIPENLSLICGDNLLEILSEAIRQTSQLSLPVDAWGKVLSWVRDLIDVLHKSSDARDTLFIIDCNPSFAIYTQLALVAADYVVVPFTADDSSRRAIENVVALLYGGYNSNDPKMHAYARISFEKRAREEGVNVPKLHTFVHNRVTLYDGKPGKAFEAMSKAIRETMDSIHRRHRNIYANPKEKPSDNFISIPDYHSASVFMSTTGTPLYKTKPGPKEVRGERIQLNKEPLDRYTEALSKFVNFL